MRGTWHQHFLNINLCKDNINTSIFKSSPGLLLNLLAKIRCKSIPGDFTVQAVFFLNHCAFTVQYKIYPFVFFFLYLWGFWESVVITDLLHQGHLLGKRLGWDGNAVLSGSRAHILPDASVSSHLTRAINSLVPVI